MRRRRRQGESSSDSSPAFRSSSYILPPTIRNSRASKLMKTATAVLDTSQSKSDSSTAAATMIASFINWDKDDFEGPSIAAYLEDLPRPSSLPPKSNFFYCGRTSLTVNLGYRERNIE
ncbi:unnamed protein product [Linum trigynum]|uniref:Uncharacterized protein n=1 Tax=Linum trigynum TaxID=586398 RepID=A0AAV2E9Y2_9ROSI